MALFPIVLPSTSIEPDASGGVGIEEAQLAAPPAQDLAAVEMDVGRGVGLVAETAADPPETPTKASTVVTVGELFIEVVDVAGQPLSGAVVEFWPDWATGFSDARFWWERAGPFPARSEMPGPRHP